MDANLFSFVAECLFYTFYGFCLINLECTIFDFNYTPIIVGALIDDDVEIERGRIFVDCDLNIENIFEYLTILDNFLLHYR